MKSKIIIALLGVFLSAGAFANTTSTFPPETMVQIRDQVKDLLFHVDKAAVDGQEEKVRICFSVNEEGTITLYHVMNASADLKQAIKDQLQYKNIEVVGDQDELMWMNATIISYN